MVGRKAVMARWPFARVGKNFSWPEGRREVTASQGESPRAIR